MQKVRVYQLAKELEVPSALILELLDRMGQDVKSDLNVLDPGVADQVRRKVSRALAAEKKRLADERAKQAAADRKSVTARAARRAAAKPAEPVEEPAAPEAPAAEDTPPVEAPPAETPAEAPAFAAASADADETAETPPAQDEAPAAAKPAAPADGPRPAARPVVKAPEVKTPAAASAPSPERPAAAAGPRLPGQTRAPRVFPAKRVPPLSALKPRKPASRGPRQHEMPAAAIRPGGPMPPPLAPGRGPTGKKRRKKKSKQEAREAAAAAIISRPKPNLPPVPENITLSEGVTVKELAEKLNRKSKDVIAKLLGRGVMATINQPLDPKIAIGVAEDFGSTAKVLTFEEEATLDASGAAAPAPAESEVAGEGETVADNPEDLKPRPPVITVMGHVDHGKTSLLDAIRAANVVDREAGGITQHIGAYQVEKNGRMITFLDTPGHEAFTMMRARGAKATDIVILVVAADDGVKPQTKEAIDHAKAAGVPIVVAINKIDKANANADRVKQQLTEHDLIVEEYGGKIVSCEVSAKKRTGIDELLELIVLEADLRELTANPDKLAGGVVLEARRDRARGVLATVLVQSGTLTVGDAFIAGAAHGKVRAMNDDHGNRVEEAGPSTPVEVMGFADEPQAGDSFQAIADEAKARQIAAFRQEKERAARQEKASARHSLERFARDIAKGEVKELPILLKADVQGSVEALQKSLGELPTDKVRVNVIRASIGAISQADVLLAAASDAIVVGFNVRPDKAAQDAARVEGVDIRTYAVIYELLDEIKQAMVGLLEPTFKEVVLGQAEVRQLFKVPKVGVIAGCYVTDGKVTRNAEVRLVRDNVVVHTGKVGSLRRFKDDAAEVKAGYECGIGIANYNDLKEGDVIEFFVMEKVAAESL